MGKDLQLIEYLGGDARKVIAMKGLPQTEVGQVLLEAVQKCVDEEDRKVHNNPVRDEKRIKNDLYFKLGMIFMGKWILSLPEEAVNVMNKQENKQ